MFTKGGVFQTGVLIILVFGYCFGLVYGQSLKSGGSPNTTATAEASPVSSSTDSENILNSQTSQQNEITTIETKETSSNTTSRDSTGSLPSSLTQSTTTSINTPSKKSSTSPSAVITSSSSPSSSTATKPTTPTSSTTPSATTSTTTTTTTPPTPPPTTTTTTTDSTHTTSTKHRTETTPNTTSATTSFFKTTTPITSSAHIQSKTSPSPSSTRPARKSTGKRQTTRPSSPTSRHTSRTSSPSSATMTPAPFSVTSSSFTSISLSTNVTSFIPTNSTKAPDDFKLTSGETIGIVIALVLLLAIATFVTILLKKRKKSYRVCSMQVCYRCFKFKRLRTSSTGSHGPLTPDDATSVDISAANRDRELFSIGDQDGGEDGRPSFSRHDSDDDYFYDEIFDRSAFQDRRTVQTNRHLTLSRDEELDDFDGEFEIPDLEFKRPFSRI